MHWTHVTIAVCVVALAAIVAAGTGSSAEEPGKREGTVAVVGARVFDGSEVLAEATVTFAGGRITGVGRALAVPAGAQVVAGRGKTLLPGLLDSHVHAYGDALERSLVFGVTTALDMFGSPDVVGPLREEQRRGPVTHRADLLSAGYAATAPGGHGTQYGLPVPTLTAASEVPAWMEARIAEGSDYVKIILEDGRLWGTELATLSPETLGAVVAAAHQHHKLAVVHVSTLEHAGQALAAGSDGLVHLFRDREADPEWVRQAVGAGLWVVPTLTVLESSAGVASGASLVEDPRLAPYLRADEVRSLRTAFPAQSETSLAPALAATRALAAAGVPILAGSDAPNPGTAHGASIHRELELLVQAGLTPVAALAAATSVPARVFGLTDRGRIAPGLKADLVLVEGDPTADVTATRAIARVWKDGREAQRPQAAAEGAASGHPRREPGVVSDFESGELAAGFGSGWQPSTDDRMGGTSTVSLTVVDGGAAGTGKALAIAGEIKSGFPFPWAGAVLMAGDVPMAPADLSAASELAFWARGDVATARVMVMAESLGQVPAEVSLPVGSEWREVVMAFSDVPGLDLRGVVWILIGGGPGQGPFRLEIDEVSLRQ